MPTAGANHILLVRSVEESAPELIGSEAILDAELEAGSLDDPFQWFARRAELLVRSLPAAYQALPAMTDALTRGLGAIFAVTALVGLLTNYLGPSQRIHVVYNPIVLLVLWNLGIYAFLVFGRGGPRRLLPGGRVLGEGKKVGPASGAPAAWQSGQRPARSGRVARWILGWSVPALWTRLHRAAGETREEARRLGAVAKEFWSQWVEVAQPLFGIVSGRALHLGAIGLALGAVLGMFVRGLFLDYHVVWRSTFITDPEIVARALRILFGLPALLAAEPLPNSQAARDLLRPEGVSADQWIWIYASAAMLFILIPRALILAAYRIRLRSLQGSLDLRLEGPYYAGILSRAKQQRVGQIEDAIKTDVRVEAGRFAEGVASYVCERLYDARIVPGLRSFREQGGRIEDLENDIASECGAFQSELDQHFRTAQEEFSEALWRAVRRSVSADVRFAALATEGLETEVGGASRDAATGIGESMGRSMNRAVGSAISAAVALVVATIGGGFGKSVGLAVIATLLGTTGPVGFLIGALVGLVAAGSAYFVGREKTTAAIKSLRLPGPVLRAALRPRWLDRLIEDGRTRCHDSVAGLIKEKLEPLTPRISDEIWRQVKPVIAERHRRAASPD